MSTHVHAAPELRRAQPAPPPPAAAPVSAAPAAQQPAPATGGLLGPLRHQAFLLLTIGRLVSVFGDFFRMVALPMVVLEMTRTTSGWGSVMAVQAVPRTLLMLLGGIVVDRYRPRNVMLAAAAILALAAAGQTGLYFTGRLEMWQIYIITAVFGVVGAFYIPAMQSIIPELVPPEEIRAANALGSSTFQLARFLAPPVAGVLLALVGAGTLFALDALSFVVLAVFLWLIAPRERQPRPAASGSLQAQFREGLRAVGADPAIWMTMIAATVATIGQVGAVMVGIPALAELVLDAGERGVGILYGAAGAGALVGALTAGAVSRLRLQTTAASAGLLISGTALAAVGYVPSVWAAVPFLVVGDALLTAASVIFFTLVQARVAAEVRGRVMGIFSLAMYGLDPLSYLFAGLVGDLFSPRAIFVYGGALLAAAGALLLSHRAVRVV